MGIKQNEQLQNSRLTELKRVIDNNLAEKGIATVGDTLFQSANKILDIETGNTVEWQPHPDWWNIETMVNTSIVPWLEIPLTNVRYGYVVTDSNNTIMLAAGYQYYLSDGSYYANGGTHTWDRSKDKPCSDGYKTRAVIVCKIANKDVEINHRSINSIYVYLGDCNVTILAVGSTSSPYNQIIQAVIFNNYTTISSLGNYAFANCYSLKSMFMPNSVTSIGNNAFYACVSLASINIPDDITDIAINTFSQCNSLTSIVVPHGVTSIGSNAFAQCNSLKSISMPQGIASIASNAFVSCLTLVSVIVPQNFNLSLNINYSAYLSVHSIEQIIYNYEDRTGNTALILTIGATNISKLSDEIKAIAYNKNITLA